MISINKTTVKMPILKVLAFIVLIILTMLPVSVSAAKFVPLTAGRLYKGYDFTGDKKCDKLKYSKNGSLTLNGKNFKIGSGKNNKFYYYRYNTQNVFIIVDSKNSVGNTIKAYRYEKRALKLKSDPIGAYNTAKLIGAKANEIYFETGPAKPANTISFKKVTNGLFKYEETYKVNSKTHKITRKSKYGRIRNTKYYYYASKIPVYLSTKADVINKNGPKLEYGDKVRVLSVYYNYSGNDAQKGKKVYELKAGKKVGWLTENKAYVFLTNKPGLSEQEKYNNSLYLPKVVELPNERLTFTWDGMRLTKIEECFYKNSPQTVVTANISYSLDKSGNTVVKYVTSPSRYNHQLGLADITSLRADELVFDASGRLLRTDGEYTINHRDFSEEHKCEFIPQYNGRVMISATGKDIYTYTNDDFEVVEQDYELKIERQKEGEKVKRIIAKTSVRGPWHMNWKEDISFNSLGIINRYEYSDHLHTRTVTATCNFDDKELKSISWKQRYSDYPSGEENLGGVLIKERTNTRCSAEKYNEIMNHLICQTYGCFGDDPLFIKAWYF